MKNVLKDAGLISRKVEKAEREGRPTYKMISECTYDANLEDLWDALTNKERLPRWFAPVDGNLELGGKYQVKNNASGTITRCEDQKGFDLTWEFAGDVSWVTVVISFVEEEKTLLRLQHEAGAEGEHFKIYGPGATGVGWDLAIGGLEYHIRTGDEINENALLPTPEGKDYIAASANAWGQASADAGFDKEWSFAAAMKTAKFFTGEETHECRIPDSE